MIDLRIISARHILKVHSFSPIRNFLPPSIVILGSELNKTTEIFYNGSQVQEFIIQSPSRVVARIPDGTVGEPFHELKVYSSAPVSKKEAELSLSLVRPFQKLSGIDRLIQMFIMVFMTTPGSDVFQKDSGGGGQVIIGRQTNKAGKGVTADLAVAIDRTKTELFKKQAKASNIPPAEKLLNCNLEQILFDKNTGTLSARVSIQNMLGDQAEVSVG